MIKKCRKRKPLAILKDKAEAVFHAWIRKRDNYICFTCDAKGSEAGHFRHGKLDFDEMNLNCQCTRCNKWLSGNQGIYAIRLIKKYGQQKVDDLVFRSNQTKKYTKEELEYIINKYK